MNLPQFIDRLKHALNGDIARKLLVRYFKVKGFENFNGLVYPPIIQDLPYIIPEMYNKVEVVPHAVKVDPIADTAVLGWNLFTLGTFRHHLGETYHNNLRHLAQQLYGGQVVTENRSASNQTTPESLIKFITRVLESHSDGYLDLNAKPNLMRVQKMFDGWRGGVGTTFFRKSY